MTPILRIDRIAKWTFLPSAILGLTLSALAASQTPTREYAPVIDVDAEAPSGWLRIELAVLIDDRNETLESEYWPPFPALTYPSQYRWLIDNELREDLAEQWRMADITTHEDGTLSIGLPDPDAIKQRAIVEAEQARWARLEALAAAEQDTAPLIISPTLRPTADAEETREPVEAVPEPPPALPEPFRLRPNSLLEDGLARYLSDNPDQLGYRAGWLQPPGAANLPILIKASSSTPWPALQGFVELRRGETIRLGVNLWLNTDAGYYPDNYVMVTPPPALPQQLQLRDQMTGRVLSEDEANLRQQRLTLFNAALAAGVTPISYVEPKMALPESPTEQVAAAQHSTTATDTEALHNDLDAAVPIEDTWPWRHSIHYADTRTLLENRIRYFDHPVIKVVATWRELTWAEVYEEGALDAASTVSEGSSPQ